MGTGALRTRLESQVRAHWSDHVPRSAIRKHWESPQASELVDNVWEHHLREDLESALQGLPDVEAEQMLEELCDFCERCFEELYGRQPQQLFIEPTKLSASGAQLLRELLETEDSVAQLQRRFSDGQRNLAFDFLLAEEVRPITRQLNNAGIPFALAAFPRKAPEAR